MHRSLNAFVYQGDAQFVAECHEIALVTQGHTLDEVTRNLQEAVVLFFEGEDPAEHGFGPNIVLRVMYELEALPHAG